MRLLRLIPAFAVLFVIAVAGMAQAKPVYLKDGGIIECESFWRKGNDFFVKVNRDLVIPFSTDEIDLKKTLHQKKKPAGRHAAPTETNDRSATIAAEPAVTGGIGKPETKPIPAPAAKEQTANKQPAVPKTVEAPVVAPLAAPATPPPPTPVPAPAPMPINVEVTPAPPAMPSLAEGNPTVVAVSFVIACAVLIIMIAGNWKIFEKAGVSGWKCLVPIYNMYLFIVISGKPGWWLILMFIPIVSVAIYLLTMLALASRFGKGPLFGVGLFFLPMIFIPLLGFDNSEYS